MKNKLDRLCPVRYRASLLLTSKAKSSHSKGSTLGCFTWVRLKTLDKDLSFSTLSTGGSQRRLITTPPCTTTPSTTEK